MFGMSSDTAFQVPNVRFNVAKTLGQLVGLVDAAAVTTRIKPCLTKMQDDSDRDVKLYAIQALQLC